MLRCCHEAILGRAPFVLRGFGYHKIKVCEVVYVYTVEDALGARPPDFVKNIRCAVGRRVFGLLSHEGDQAAVGQQYERRINMPSLPSRIFTTLSNEPQMLGHYEGLSLVLPPGKSTAKIEVLLKGKSCYKG